MPKNINNTKKKKKKEQLRQILIRQQIPELKNIKVF